MIKIVTIDLDGTLFDTKDVNYNAYNEALKEYGFSIDYDYYCKFCNGRLYKEFIPQIIGDNLEILESVHKNKKELYSKYLDKARINEELFSLIETIKDNYYIALVTTASKKNTMEILNNFNKTDLFDLILTHDDITKNKPDPEGFIKAMDHFNIDASNSIIFEDSKPGIEAAKKSGATTFVAIGFNE